MRSINVLAVSGSLRRQSYNTSLLRAAQDLAPDGMQIEIQEIGEFPLFNDDVRAQGYPAIVQAFRDRIAAADGLLIACPEYNHSVTGVLKNAIDWASRPPGNLFDAKPLAIVGAATGLFGSIRAQAHLRAIASGMNCQLLHKPEVLVGGASGKFDAEGRLTDDTARGLLRDLLANLATTVTRNRTLAAA